MAPRESVVRDGRHRSGGGLHEQNLAAILDDERVVRRPLSIMIEAEFVAARGQLRLRVIGAPINFAPSSHSLLRPLNARLGHDPHRHASNAARPRVL
jgi:hypothetical protein